MRCRNGGTCEFNEATKTTRCLCTARYTGPECEAKGVEQKVQIVISVGGVLLNATLATAGFLFYRLRKAGEKAATTEAAKRESSLAEQVRLEAE